MKPARGFIALISAIIISTVLLAVAATLDQGVFFARFDGLNGEYHAIAAHLADGCIETALLKLRDDYDYTVEDDSAYDPAQGGVPVAEGTLYGTKVACLLLGPTTTPTEVAHTRSFTVTARATFNSAFSTQQVTATVFNPHYSQGMVPIVSMSGLHEIP
jgi:hypothetical protein